MQKPPTTYHLRELFQFVLFLITFCVGINQSLAQQRATIFYDSAYTQVCTDFFCEAYNIKETLLDLNIDIRNINQLNPDTIIDAMQCAEFLVIPETEVGDFAADIDLVSAQFIRDFVFDGGGLIVMGSAGFNSGSSTASANLNSIFGFSLIDQSFISFGSTDLNVQSSMGTAFENGPDTLVNLTSTNFVNNSFPAGSKQIYGDSIASTVVQIPYGEGEIIFLGWSWFRGGPGQSQDASVWEQILELSIAEISNGYIYPDCISCDQYPPQALAYNQSEVSVDSFGILNLSVQSIDSASVDNCGIQNIVLIDQQGAPVNPFNCAQLEDTIPIGMVVTDSVALRDTAWLSIVVIDTIFPVINCIPDITIKCDENLPILTQPSTSDNCGIDSIWQTDIVNLNFCNVGNVERVWYVRDVFGNVSSCIQTVHIVRDSLPIILFPINYSINCVIAPPNLAPDQLPISFGFPSIDSVSDCSSLYAEYNDVVTGICLPIGFTIERTWTVLDSCDANFSIQQIQLLEVFDNSPPFLSCAVDRNLYLSTTQCMMDIDTALVILGDDCDANPFISDFIITDTTGSFSFLNPVLPGVYTVKEKAVDACGNLDSCIHRVSVLDSLPPVPNHLPTYQVNISTSGAVPVCATDLEQGSTDNCQVSSILISRDSLNFSPCVNFECADVAVSPHTIIFRTYDPSGNFEDASVIISVVDTMMPSLICPTNAVVDCSMDYPYLPFAQEPVIMNNCDAYTVNYVDNNIGPCGLGSFERTWVISTTNFIDSCIQIITVVDNVNPTLIVPPDITLLCDDANISPDSTGFLEVFDDCGQYQVDFTDILFDICAPGKMLIQRTWQAVNNCNPIENYTFTQEIRIDDLNRPIFDFPPIDLVRGVNDTTCLGSLDLPAYAITDNCDLNPDLDVVVTDMDNNILTNFDNLSIGVYQVMLTAVDDCGNNNSALIDVEVKDLVPPEIVCVDTVIAVLQTSEEVTVFAFQFDAGTTDHCTPDNELVYRFASNGPVPFVVSETFDCNDLGFITRTFIAIDNSSNLSSCEIVIEVVDPFSFCPVTTTANIGGRILTETSSAATNVEIDVLPLGANFTQSNINGVFNIMSIPVNTSYEIIPDKNIFHGNGVSTFDIFLIRKHLLNIDLLDSPYKVLAADANNDNKISTIDIVNIRKVILDIVDTFPNNRSWRFIPDDWVFVDSLNPWTPMYPEQITISNLSQDRSDLDFVAVKVGDVNNDVDPTMLVTDDRGQGLNIRIDEVSLNSDEVQFIPLYIEEIDQLSALQFRLDLGEELNSINIVGGSISESNGFATFESIDNIDPHYAMLWDNAEGKEIDPNEPALILAVDSKRPQLLSRVLQLNDNQLKARAYTSSGEEFKLALNFEHTAGAKAPSISLHPNPFKSELNLSIQSNEQHSEIEIFDYTGKTIHYEIISNESQHSHHQFDASIFREQGIYFIKVSLASQSILKKVIFH